MTAEWFIILLHRSSARRRLSLRLAATPLSKSAHHRLPDLQPCEVRTKATRQINAKTGDEEEDKEGKQAGRRRFMLVGKQRETLAGRVRRL